MRDRPTNTMRACTAVVTELSYNYSDISYRAEIEFITEEDWRKELTILFQDLLNDNGEVSRDSSNLDRCWGRVCENTRRLSKENQRGHS